MLHKNAGGENEQDAARASGVSDLHRVCDGFHARSKPANRGARLAPIIHGFLVVEGLGSAKTPS